MTDDKLKPCPQFCYSDWWNSLQDAERSAIIRDPQWSRERIFKAGYVEGARATDTQVTPSLDHARGYHAGLHDLKALTAEENAFRDTQVSKLVTALEGLFGDDADFDMFDCVDNCGLPYQSKAFAEKCKEARTALDGIGSKSDA